MPEWLNNLISALGGGTLIALLGLWLTRRTDHEKVQVDHARVQVQADEVRVQGRSAEADLNRVAVEAAKATSEGWRVLAQQMQDTVQGCQDREEKLVARVERLELSLMAKVEGICDRLGEIISHLERRDS